MNLANRMLAVVRGEVPWHALNTEGLDVRREGDGWSIPFVRIPALTPSIGDVAQGIKNLSSRPEELREWASFVLAAASLDDLGSLENSPDGEDLLSALWDIAFGDPLDVKSKCHLEKWLEKG